MNNEERTARRFYAVSYDEEEPTVTLGAFIPPRPKKRNATFSYTPASVSGEINGVRSPYILSVKVVTMMFALLLCLFAGRATAPYVRSVGVTLGAELSASKVVQSPVPVIIQNPYTAKQEPLNYGVQVALSEPNFFTETRNAFIEGEKTFIEVDLTTMQLRYFAKGVLQEQVPILSKGQKGSWWETPAGLYEV